MVKPKAPPSFDLFDVIEQEERKEGAACSHRREHRTMTIWPNALCDRGKPTARMTMTCEGCGRVRGRYPNE